MWQSMLFGHIFICLFQSTSFSLLKLYSTTRLSPTKTNGLTHKTAWQKSAHLPPHIDAFRIIVIESS